MVLAEAMAAKLAIVASSSGAIPEVAASSARYFSPGDWVMLAEILGDVLSLPTGQSGPEADRATAAAAARYSTQAAAARIAAAYTEVLAGRGA